MIARRELRALFATAAIAVATLCPAAVAQASFGIVPGSFKATALNRDGSVDVQAGSHPFDYSVEFEFNHDSEHNAEGSARDIVVQLPPGLVGNATKIPRCPREDLAGLIASCPGDTQVGTFAIVFQEPGGGLAPAGAVYNLVPPKGAAASFGFTAAGFNAIENAGVIRSGAGYRAAVSSTNISKEHALSVQETIWGVPADKGHDPERECIVAEVLTRGCSTETAPTTFLRLPTACGTPLHSVLQADSAEAPEQRFEEFAESLDTGGQPVGLFGCESLDFAPSIAVAPETTASDSPTGLHVDLHVPQPESPEGLAEADLKDAKVTLPPGLVVNPSSANGLQACSSAQLDLEGQAQANCPDASKIGSVEVDTPLLDHPLPGAVYLAAQGDNPFGSLLAIYIAIDDPQTGTVVKLAGRVEPGPQTGQLTTTFTENPQLPFEDFKLDFFGGLRAALTTAPTCGAKTTTTDLTPWSSPEGADAFPTSSFVVSSGPNGSACPNTEAEESNKPSFEAGTTTPIAGAYSPFVLRLTRENGSQPLGAIDATLPPGLLGRLAGVGECSDAQIAAATARSHPGEGTLEQASPSCPLSSEVGTVTVGAGSGSPLYVQGHAYLAGPYKGAPLSLVVITPAVAGPFDLGSVVIRNALYVNPETTQITAKSDPIPHILQGIPLDIRSIALNMNRPDFTLNPTNCDPMAVLGSATSILGNTASLSNRFQVGACGALGFKPSLKLSLEGGTKRNQNPALKAVVTYPKKGSYANIAKAQVTLPHSAFLDQSHIGTVCTRVQFAAHACPAASVYGKAIAYTPLLDQPLSGPVYLRSSSNKLPDLVADLNGQIEVTLAGKIDTGKEGGIRNTFQLVPDAPVSKFVLSMQGGNKGLLVNSENICSKPQKALAHFVAQNGKVDNFSPLIANSCTTKGKRKHKAHGRH